MKPIYKNIQAFLLKSLCVLLTLSAFISIFQGGVATEYIIQRFDTDYAQEINLLKTTYVYKTTHGEKYHRSYHYSNRNYRITLYYALNHGLDACKVCKPIKRTLPAKGYLWLIYIPIRISITLLLFLLMYYTCLSKRLQDS